MTEQGTSGREQGTSGLAIVQHFTTEETHPFAAVKWETRDAVILGKDGTPVFEARGVEFPSFWSQRATDIVASKYFRIVGEKRETSVREMLSRVVDTIACWGVESGYFDIATGDVFAAELTHILLHQYAAFNSPVWFNVGVQERPQTSACFTVDVQDSMESILDWYKQEGIIFKGGSGCGVDLSAIRAAGSPLSNGGVASGVLSFMKVADANAGAIKSGGSTRRAAAMRILNVEHPEIEAFIQCKVEAERLARALMELEYGNGIENGAYDQVPWQNANNSVSVPKKFMEAATRSARLASPKDRRCQELLFKIAQAAWVCGDPGLFFRDTINAWHTTPNRGPIIASNPCQPGIATVLTPQGIRTFDDIEEGDLIWSGQKWTSVVRKVYTGVKPVYEYHTAAGVFVGTKEHRVISGGDRVEAQYADVIDIAKGSGILPPHPALYRRRSEGAEFDAQAVVDGLVLGDGVEKVTHKGTGHLWSTILLYVEKDDTSYFLPESGVSCLTSSSIVPVPIDPKPFDRPEKCAHHVKTTWTVGTLGRTYERKVPQKYFIANDTLKRSFLRGLYSANGSIVSNRVTLKARSFDVISSVQMMLSSLGIGSYYTTNKAHDVEFDNGTYTCKESYDLNIVADRRLFAELIGFIQPEKQARLDAICDVSGFPGRSKQSFDVVSVRYIGDLPVWDITVSVEEHTYWTGGLLVSNCGEHLQPPNTACNLASINLIKFLKDDGSFDMPAFSHTVDIMITAMDILIDRSSYPSETVARNSRDYRPLGLGYCNLGAFLMAKGLPYDSDAGRAFAAAITALLTGEAYYQSARLGSVKGVFPGFRQNCEAMSAVMQSHYKHASTLLYASTLLECNTVPTDLAIAAVDRWLDVVDAQGFRNCQVTVLAPCGTISFMMDADTTGIEPCLGLVTTKSLVGGGEVKIVNGVIHKALTALGYDKVAQSLICARIYDDNSLKSSVHINKDDVAVFATALGENCISWLGHIRMVAAVQPFLSGGVSKTINMPHSATVQDVFDAYVMAWKTGLKAISIYRDGSKGIQPVVVEKSPLRDFIQAEESKIECVRPGSVVVVPNKIVDIFGGSSSGSSSRHRLPDERQSLTHKFTINNHEGYITVGLYDDGRPGELFVRMSKEGSTLGGLMDAWATAVSIALQYGVPLEVFTQKFKDTQYEPRGFTGNPDIKVVSSVTDYIARWLELKFGSTQEQKGAIPTPVGSITFESAPPCPECGNMTVRNGSCCVCPVCGTTTGCS